MNEIPMIHTMPLVALRGMNAFPKMTLHFDVERPISTAAIHAAMAEDQKILLLTQREVALEEPGQEDLYTIGTVCNITQMLRIPGHGVRILVEGLYRAKVLTVNQTAPYISATIEELQESNRKSTQNYLQALLRQCHEQFEHYLDLMGNRGELQGTYPGEEPGYLADFIAQSIFIDYRERQLLLEEINPVKRLKKMLFILSKEVEILELKQGLQEKAGQAISKNQRDYFLREQVKVIQEELGEGESLQEECENYQKKIVALSLPKEEEEKLLKETKRLRKQPPNSPETALIRTYLDTVLALPWNKLSKDKTDIEKAQKILDKDHFGMEQVKQRILELLAVKQLAPDLKGGVLCLVGPPGVGKTSIAQSLAKAMGRNFARLSLGGVHDEADIRGHRKTYIGAMPGRIMASIGKAGSKNPLILMDEIDKLGRDHKGDPASALLEAFDGEQNSSFRDHYLEVPFDLSEVLFVTTANSLDTIPRPLRDRMEIIELTSYTDEEKLQIAKNHLLPKARKKHGLDGTSLRITEPVLRDIIAGYTRESGVRQLERELATICRKTAMELAKGEQAVSLKSNQLPQFLGAYKYRPDPKQTMPEIGLVKGLAWTQVGGEILPVEANVVEGTGKLELTGNLGDVMKESAKAALSYIRARAGKLGIQGDFYKSKDIHIHFPQGAIPKNGPSAGIAIALAMVSALTQAPVKGDIAMTGEITLRGRVLMIGGLKEKTMAALRSGVKTVILPAENEKDLEEIPATVRSALQFVFVSHMDQVLDTALLLPKAKKGKKAEGILSPKEQQPTDVRYKS